MRWLILFLPVVFNKMRVPQIRLPSSQHVKYMPMGYDKPKVVPCPAPSTSSSSSGGGFNLWSFMTAGVVAATVVGNIVDNVNDNNNNNNNNNNQDNQNSNNMNINNNDNMNMNMNMLNMAMGRALLEEWVEEEKKIKIKKKLMKEKEMEEREMEEKSVEKEDQAEMEKDEEESLVSSRTEWMKGTSSSSSSSSSSESSPTFQLVFKLVYQLVCKCLTLWMEALTADCAARMLCEAAQHELAQRSPVSTVLQRLVTLAAGFVMAEWGARLDLEKLLKATDAGFQDCHNAFPCIPKMPF